MQEYDANLASDNPIAGLGLSWCSDLATDDHGFLYIADEAMGTVDIYGPYTSSTIPATVADQVKLAPKSRREHSALR